MKKPFVTFPILLVLAAVVIPAYPARAAETRYFTQGTAYTLPKGRVESGVFSPLRAGLFDDLELSVHPVWMFLWPNAALKKQWMRRGNTVFATSHTLEVPTPLLRLLSIEGTGGVLPNDNTIPWFLLSEHRAIVTVETSPGQDLTFYAGFAAAAHVGERRMDTIDYPLVYPRLAALYQGVHFRAGIDLDGRLVNDFYYSVDVDVFWMPGSEGTWAVEQSTGILYRPHRRFAVFAGYKYAHSRLPFGGFVTIVPLVDFLFTF